MKKRFSNIIAIFLFLSTLSSVSIAGAIVIVSLTTGEQYTWQFEEFEEAADFFADRIEAGKCSPNVSNLEIKSIWIAGLDDEEDKFSYYHGIGKEEYALKI